MVKTLQAQVSSSKLSLMDIGAIAVTKTLSERVLAKAIGNGSLFSGAIKLGGAVVSSQAIKGKTGDVIGTALAVDGFEDIVTSFFGSGNRSIISGRGSDAGVRVI